MFRKKEPGATAPAIPTDHVLVRTYDMRTVKDNRARLNSLAGLDDKSIRALAAVAQADANWLAQHGYAPVAQTLTSANLAAGPVLTMTFIRHGFALQENG